MDDDLQDGGLPPSSDDSSNHNYIKYIILGLVTGVIIYIIYQNYSDPGSSPYNIFDDTKTHFIKYFRDSFKDIHKEYKDIKGKNKMEFNDPASPIELISSSSSSSSSDSDKTIKASDSENFLQEILTDSEKPYGLGNLINSLISKDNYINIFNTYKSFIKEGKVKPDIKFEEFLYEYRNDFSESIKKLNTNPFDVEILSASDSELLDILFKYKEYYDNLPVGSDKLNLLKYYIKNYKK